MSPEHVEERIAQLSFQPLTSPATGRLLYVFAAKGAVEEIVELGCAHGTSTAYLAAATLEAKGAGLVLDLRSRGRPRTRTEPLHRSATRRRGRPREADALEELLHVGAHEDRRRANRG